MDKLDYYENHVNDLAEQGIVYKPIALTAFGRRHRCPTKMLHQVATSMARQQGCSSAIGPQRSGVVRLGWSGYACRSGCHLAGVAAVAKLMMRAESSCLVQVLRLACACITTALRRSHVN